MKLNHSKRNTMNNLSLELLMTNQEEHIKTLYLWHQNEMFHENYTCRPVKKFDNYDDYACRIKTICQGGIYTFLLKNQGELVGKITLFDHNKRNHSAEFGYYIPKTHRKKGFGTILLRSFVDQIFLNEELGLYKLYATTASGNLGSVKLLENHGFSLDGRIRDHYWFDDRVEDQLHYSLLRSEWQGMNRNGVL